MIALNDAALGYGDRPVLTDVTVSLEPGGFYVLTGPSGAGKTTFLNACSLRIPLQAGTIHHFGDRIDGTDRDAVARLRRRLGFIHQDARFLDHLDLVSNVALPLDLAGKNAAEALSDIEDLLDWVGLAPRKTATPPELSGGERQRAALARALVLSPDIVLADEPTGNVDRDMGQRMFDLLVELNRLGRTIIVATHDMDLIRTLKAQATLHVLRLSAGRLSVAGSPL